MGNLLRGFQFESVPLASLMTTRYCPSKVMPDGPLNVTEASDSAEWQDDVDFQRPLIVLEIYSAGVAPKATAACHKPCMKSTADWILHWKLTSPWLHL
jgi:hypothetical protein